MDTSVFFFINRGTVNPLFDVLMPFLSSRGYLLILPFLFYLVVRALKARDATGRTAVNDAVWTIAVAVLSVVIIEYAESLIKPFFSRIRPCHALEGVRLLTPCLNGYSMPSGHALSSFAFATPLIYLTRKHVSLAARSYPFALASLVAFSRVYLGVHYPSDVIVGALLGAGIGLLLSLGYEWGVKRKVPAR